jgi:chemotaxis protein MotB
MAEKEGQAPPPPKRKKKGGHGGHHGGAWKVAFADFMTSMFALFLVLWVIATSSSSERAAMANYFRNPTLFMPGSNKPVIINPTNEGGTEQTNSEGSSNSETTNQLDAESKKNDEVKLDKLQEQLTQDSALKELGTQFKVEMTDQGLKIELNEAGTTGVFQMGSAELTPAMAEQIAHISQAISGIDNRVVVAGYTDKYAFSGSKYTNWQLSADRANAVRSRLIGSGVDTSRMAAVVGYGDNELANPQSPYSPENRRVSLLILKNSKNFTLGAK